MVTATESGAGTAPAVAGAGDGGEHRHRHGLILVAIFKLSKAIFFTIVGVGALHMIHRDMGEMVMKLVNLFHADPEWHIVRFVEDRADLVSNHQLRRAGAGALGYAVVCVIEGIGLIKEKSWAEYFTVTLTVLALPWEIFELFREPTGFKWGLLALNLIVLGYLLLVIQWSRRAKAGK